MIGEGKLMTSRNTTGRERKDRQKEPGRKSNKEEEELKRSAYSRGTRTGETRTRDNYEKREHAFKALT